MKIITKFLSENFQFWVMKFSMYLNRRVFIMKYFSDIVDHLVEFIFLSCSWSY